METKQITYYGNAYSLRALIPVTPEGNKEVSLTIPGMAIEPENIIEHYRTNAIERKLTTYYEEEGIEIPNFDRMDQIERLMAFAEMKRDYKEKKEEAEKKVADHEAKKKAAAEKAAAEKVGASKSKTEEQ